MPGLRWVVLPLSVALAGCSAVPLGSPGAAAKAELHDANGRMVAQATLVELTGGVRIILEARDLPAGLKAVHIHATGNCEPPDFASAGDHFNPEHREHGILNPAGPHAGDLPNLMIGRDGRGRLETFTERINLSSGPLSIVDGDGVALVVHAAPDDFQTDPSGNSGPRIACGTVVKTP
jgi:superoxide dismutase, Cu-Zn family